MAISPVSFSKSDKNPVGMIVQSMLTEAQFQAENGTSWILADGRSITGSRYATLTGSSTAPDLRGMVLRGKNNGRADGNQDPDGERSLGSFQNHAFNSHSHGGATPSGGAHNHTSPPGNNAGVNGGTCMTTITDVQCAGTGGNVTINSTNSAHSHTINADGGNETRMRNVAVNHFIKINP